MAAVKCLLLKMESKQKEDLKQMIFFSYLEKLVKWWRCQIFATGTQNRGKTKDMKN